MAGLAERIEALSTGMPQSERTVFMSMAMRRASALKRQGMSDNAILAELGDTVAVKKERSLPARLIRSKGTILSVAVAMVLSIGGAAFAWNTVTDSIKPGSVDAIGVNQTNETEVSEYGDTKNILFTGTDFRDGANRYGEGGDNDVEGLRTDVLMLAMIPKDRSRVTIISFPRDSDVSMNNCHSYDMEKREYGGLLPDEHGVKINSLYQRGGPACLVSTIGDLTGVPIETYIEADFSAFVEAVNAVGGVTVCPKTPLIDDELGTVIAKPGKQVIKGKTALQYVRARKVEGTSKTDFDRIKRQQSVVMSVFRKVKSEGILSSPSRLLELGGVAARNIRIDGIDMSGLVDLANSLRNLPESRFIVQTAPVTGVENPDTHNVELDTAKLKSIATLAGDEKASDGSFTTASTLPRKQVDITIQAQNPENAKVKALARELRAAGFGAVDIVRSANPAPSETYIAWSSGNGNSAATLSQALQGAPVYRSGASDNLGATLVTGRDVGDLSVTKGYRSGIEGKLPNASDRKMTYQQVFGLLSNSKHSQDNFTPSNAKIDACS